MLQALMEKAKSGAGMGSCDVNSDGDFSLVQENATPGAMSDGAKGDDSSPVEITAKKIGLSIGTARTAPSIFSSPLVSGYVADPVSAGLNPPIPADSKELKLALPSKVPDMAT